MIIHATSQDGLWSVIEAVDYNMHCAGIGRSRTRDTPGDALKAPWDPNINVPTGPGSVHKFVMVRTMDLPGFPLYQGRLPISPKGFIKSGIPDYPHTCHVCGGRMLILFSSVEHEGGECPGPQKKKKGLYA